MGNPYTSVSATGYNSNPPADDGSQVADNEISWSKHKDKLGDPLKTLADAINANVLTAFGTVFGSGVTTKTTAYTIATSDRGKRVGVTNATTITLLAAATAGTAFSVTLANDGTDVVGIDGDGTETVDGDLISYLYPGESYTIISNGTNGWLVIADGRIKEAAGTFKYGLFTTADGGYIIPNGDTIGNAASGADTAAEYTEKLFEKVKLFEPNAGTEVFASNDTVVLPDMRSSIPVGYDNLGGTSADIITDVLADTLGGVMGAWKVASAGTNGSTGGHALTSAENGPHTHTVGPFSLNVVSNSSTGSVWMSNAGGTVTTSSSGSGTPHNHTGPTYTGSATSVLQPSFFCGAQIKL